MAMTWDYLAGFTDGEGYIGVVRRGARITWGQRDEKMLAAVRVFLLSEGFNPLWYKRPAKPPKKPNPIFALSLCRRDEVLRAIDRLEPLLIFKAPNCAFVREWNEKNPKLKNRSPINADVVRQLVADGFSGNGAGSRLKCSRQRIYKIAREAGIPLRPGGGRSENGRRLEAMTDEQWRAHRRGKEKNAACADCGKAIYPQGTRCISCAMKKRHQEDEQSFRGSNTKPVERATDRSAELENE